MNPHEIIMTKKDNENFNNAEECFYCCKKFKDDDKVRDHCHFTGTYRGASCNSCNLEEGKRTRFLPVHCHNLSGYDMNLIIKELYTVSLSNEYYSLKFLPQTKEKIHIHHFQE